MKVYELINKYDDNIDYNGKRIETDKDYYYVLLKGKGSEYEDKWDRIVTIFTKDDFNAWETIYTALSRWELEYGEPCTYLTLTDFKRL